MPAIFKVAAVEVFEKSKWMYTRVHRKRRMKPLKQNVAPALGVCLGLMLVKWQDVGGKVRKGRDEVSALLSRRRGLVAGDA